MQEWRHQNSLPPGRQHPNSGIGVLQRTFAHSINTLQCLWHTVLGTLQQRAQEPPALKDRTCRASLPRKTRVLGSEKRAEPSSAINCQGSWRAPQTGTPQLCQNWVSILPAYHQGNQWRKSVTCPDSESTRSREQGIAFAKKLQGLETTIAQPC